MDNVRVIKLAHDAGLGQEFPSLLLGVPRFQCLNSHHNLSFPWQSQWSTTHLSKLACRTGYSQQQEHQDREGQVKMSHQVNVLGNTPKENVHDIWQVGISSKLLQFSHAYLTPLSYMQNRLLLQVLA